VHEPPPFNPLGHPVCFSPPTRLAQSAWIQHVPFGMTLIDLLRPATVVELGTHYGVSYCAFCQAVAELGLPARCYAIDTWEGDAQAGFYGPEVLADLRAHHDPAYGGFSRLVRSTFDEAAGQFEDGSVDLLHIDGLHTYEAVRHDFDTWVPKLSDRGVVLVHDTNCRERDFGVWRLWEELRQRHAHFEFVHGHGLGVLAVGRSCPPSISQLFGLPPEQAMRLRQFYFRLGRQIEEGYERVGLGREVQARVEQIAGLEARLLEADSRSATAEQALACRASEAEAAEAEAEELRRLLTDRDETIASLRAKVERPAGSEPGAARRIPYARVVTGLRAAVARVAPAGAVVLVVSRGDPDLLELGPARGRHFPQTADGVYAGAHPASGSAAIEQLESLRAAGARFLAVPGTAYWWFEYYADFVRHLDARYQRVWADSDCVVYRLTRGASEIWHRLRGLVAIGRPHNGNGSGLAVTGSGFGGEELPTARDDRPGAAGARTAPDHPPAAQGDADAKPFPQLRFALEYPRSLPLTPPRVASDPQHLRLNWLLPDFAPGMGGPAVVFRMIGLLDALGHRSTLWVCGRTRYESAEDARESIAEHYQPLNAEVRFLPDTCGPEVLAAVRGDAVIATHYRTAYTARAVTNVRERFYFIQDFEPAFCAAGTEYRLAEATYRFEFSCITSGRWLRHVLQTRYGTPAEHFVYAYDAETYRPGVVDDRRPDRVAFYARHETPRRAVELGVMALELVAARRPGLVVDLFGGDTRHLRLPFRHVHHGVLPPPRLADLYRRATVGMVFSTTNYSLIPHEMMACGLPVIDLLGENTSAEFREGTVTLSDADPHQIADAVERLLSDPAARDAQADRARQYVRGLTWERAGMQVEAAIRVGILARASVDGTGTRGANGALAVRSRAVQPVCRGEGADDPAVTCHGPIVFVGQPEYYRSAYYDLTATGEHFEFPVTSADWSGTSALPARVREWGARTVVVFRPEWFARHRDAFEALRAEGVTMIGYSSEPVPQSRRSTHPDQLQRLEGLKRAMDLDYDLIIHFDPSSVGFLREIGFRRVIGYPLPVSRRLFYPEERPLDFDVCFLGKSTAHRERMLLPLKMRFNTVHVAHGLRDEEARVLMNRSKLVLNLHNEDYLNFENRVVQALFCGRPVFSEQLSNDLLTAGRDYVRVSSPDDLCTKVASFLARGEPAVPPAVRADLSTFTVDALLARLNYQSGSCSQARAAAPQWVLGERAYQI
jgi:glycosyltransferase involved in cell wall biosynthesis